MLASPRHIFRKVKLNWKSLHAQSDYASKGEESKKVIVSESLATAIWRSKVHLAPILTSITILAINLHGLYIGIDFSDPVKSDTINLVFLQLAAKAHEIMVVASLGVIVLQCARHQLLFGDGLPLGLIGSGLAFSNFGFFFSKEFWGALRHWSYRGNTAGKLGFLAVLVIAGLTAVLVGPASAVLLVPKTQIYPSGGTDFYLNGSASQLWPADLSGDISELQQYCSAENSTTLGICPAGGFSALSNRWNQMNFTNFIDQNIPAYAQDLAGSRFYWPVQSPETIIPPLYAIGDPRPDNSTLQADTWVVQTHAASAVVLQRIATDWWNILTSQVGINPLQIGDRNVMSSVPSVISSVRCTEAQNISAAETTIKFPTIQGRWKFAEYEGFVVDSLNTTATDSLRFQWVHLPDQFGASSIGAVFETPWTLDGQSRVVVGCSAQAGWVPTNVLTDAYTFWSGWYPWNIQFGERAPSWTAAHLSSPTNGRIALGDAWLQLLTPPAPSLAFQITGRQPSTIESMLHGAGLADIGGTWNGTTLTEDWQNGDLLHNSGKTRLLEAIVCSILADGLSRSGSHRMFDTTGSSTEWSLSMYNPRADFSTKLLQGGPAFVVPEFTSSEYTTLYVRMQISGYSYQISLAGYLSMTVLLTHMAMALTYMLWVFWHKRTSQSWNSIAELLVLSQNSQPAPKALKNTCAGIDESKTFAREARIRVRTQTESTDSDHVELIFDELADAADATVPPNTGERSGTATAPEVHNLGAAHVGRGWTFPLPSNKSILPTTFDLGRLAESSERLIPNTERANEQNIGTVQVSHAYG